MKSIMVPSSRYQVSEIELIYKSKFTASSRPLIKESQDAHNVLMEDWDRNKIDFVEQFKIVLLNTACRVLTIYEVSTGGISGTVADPRIIFVAALKAKASSIILAHNHPSGNLSPSNSDLELTHDLKQGGKVLRIKIMDHLIITSESYLSFADQGFI